MNMILARKRFTPAGIFGELSNENGIVFAVTLEHSYDCVPKLPVGTYTCRRGLHRLKSMSHDFTTFEVVGVPDHSGILFHVGNVNSDSEGCILLGEEACDKSISDSRVAFENFMMLQSDVDEFILVVK